MTDRRTDPGAIELSEEDLASTRGAIMKTRHDTAKASLAIGSRGRAEQALYSAETNPDGVLY